MKIKPWELEILQELLLDQGITNYELLDLEYEGRILPERFPGEEVEAISGLVVTSSAVYHFWLDWTNKQYTLGGDSWYEIDTKEFIDEMGQKQIFEMQTRLQQQEGIIANHYRFWSPQLLNFTQESLKKSFGDNWGYNIFQNAEKFYRIKDALLSLEKVQLQIINEKIDQQGMMFSLKTHGKIKSLQHLSETIIDLLTKQCELLFFFIPFRTKEEIRFWFAIGKPGHGHIGVFVFNTKDIENFEELKDWDYLPYIKNELENG